MSLIDELHKLMKEKKYTYAYTAKAMNISSTALASVITLSILFLIFETGKKAHASTTEAIIANCQEL